MLSPYRVLDLTDDRGHMTGFLLAQLGAEVIAVEPAGGQRARRIGPFAGGIADPERSLLQWSYDRGKRSVVVEGPDAAAQLERLAAEADVLIECGAPPADLVDLAELRRQQPRPGHRVAVELRGERAEGGVVGHRSHARRGRRPGGPHRRPGPPAGARLRPPGLGQHRQRGGVRGAGGAHRAGALGPRPAHRRLGPGGDDAERAGLDAAGAGRRALRAASRRRGRAARLRLPLRLPLRRRPRHDHLPAGRAGRAVHQPDAGLGPRAGRPRRRARRGRLVHAHLGLRLGRGELDHPADGGADERLLHPLVEGRPVPGLPGAALPDHADRHRRRRGGQRAVRGPSVLGRRARRTGPRASRRPGRALPRAVVPQRRRPRRTAWAGRRASASTPPRSSVRPGSRPRRRRRRRRLRRRRPGRGRSTASRSWT